MLLTDLAADLKALLHDSASKFTAANDADFVRQLQFAAMDMGRKRPRTMAGSFVAAADVDQYPAPADMCDIKAPVWGRAEQRSNRPWSADHPGRLPTMRLIEVEGSLTISLFPAPTAAQISCLGQDYRYFYYAGHTLSDTEGGTSVRPCDRDLLLLRATAQAMAELAFDGVTKPVRLGSGVGSMPKNGTPAALAEMLMQHWAAAA